MILAQCAQLSGRHFDQAELDSTWDSCITALQELGRYHSRAEGYVHHLRSLRERAMNDYVCKSSIIKAVICTGMSIDDAP